MTCNAKTQETILFSISVLQTTTFIATEDAVMSTQQLFHIVSSVIRQFYDDFMHDLLQRLLFDTNNKYIPTNVLAKLIFQISSDQNQNFFRTNSQF